MGWPLPPRSQQVTAVTVTSADQSNPARELRTAMGQVAAAVSVVTTLAGNRPHGTTVSAFMSLSMEPPMILVSLDRTSALLELLDVGSPVGLNVLAAHQDQIALRFATKGEDKFGNIAWQVDHGAPALIDRHAWVAGEVAELVSAGDHVLVLIDVAHANAGGQAPLTYWQRTFGTHAAF